jgi:hypothetical protein
LLEFTGIEVGEGLRVIVTLMLCADVKPKKGKKENVPKTIGASINANAKTTNAKAKVFTRI